MILKYCEKHQEKFLNLVRVVSNDLDVDDLISGESTVQQAFELYKSAKSVMASGGFNLRKWHTNSLDLRKLIEQVEIKNSEGSLQ